MSGILQNYRSEISVQTVQGSAVTSGNFSTGTEAIIDNTSDGGSENAKGAIAVSLVVEVNPSFRPQASGAYCALYVSYSKDDTNWTDYEGFAEVQVSTTVDSVFAGSLAMDMPYAKVKGKAIGEDFDFALVGIPIFMDFGA